ncbi:putative ATP binding protein [marine actinobacterium PHSC20C1]|nr:putative ATP binding protein [marine actinobacterium PHSC20C1]
MVGAGGVGNAIAKIAARRDFFELMVVSDVDSVRAHDTIEWIAAKHPEAAGRFLAAQVDAANPDKIAVLARDHEITHVINAVEPKFVPTIFTGALDAGADYLDMAMSLSEPHPSDPHSKTGVKLGDDQFAQSPDWEKAGRLALVGMGVEPGLSDVFARYASDELFSEIDEIGTRIGANLVVRDEAGNEIFAPTFSIWTTIEECLNPPVVWEDGAGWFTTPPLSEPEVFMFPVGIGPLECVSVEHEEVMLMPRWLNAKRVTFKYGLGSEFIGILKTLNRLGLDKTTPVQVRSADGPVLVSPRDVVAAGLPDPSTLGAYTTGKTCAGVWVTGTGVDGKPRELYLYHVSDNEWTMAEYESQCVAWQKALNPVIALELLATKQWVGSGVLGPEAFDAGRFLELMARPVDEGGYGQSWRIDERKATPIP